MSEKHNATTRIVFGTVLPLCIVGVVVCNLVFQTVYCPRTGRFGGGPRLVWSNESTEIAFWVTFKLALAFAMVCWFQLSNHPKTEWLSLQGLYLSVAIVVIAAIASVLVAVLS